MFHSRQSSIVDISEELARDQVLAGQTLKLCNCALFSGRIQIETVKDAVLLLGEEMLIKSVITAAVNNYYHQTGTSGYSLCKGGLFFHAVSVAYAAEQIAEKTEQVAPNIAYTTGLLHDIGKVVLDQYVADRAPLLFRKLSDKSVSMLDAEKKIIRITHCEAGMLLAKKWNFSTGLLDIIQYHHCPEKSKENKSLAYTIYLANLLMEKFNAGFDLEKMQTDSLEKALDHVGFTMDDLPGLIDSIPINEIYTLDTPSEKRQAP